MNVQIDTGQTSEVLGVFGFSWWEKVLTEMRRALKGTGGYKYVSQFWKNKILMLNLDREYLSLIRQGYNKAEKIGGSTLHPLWGSQTNTMALKITKKLNVPLSVVHAYLMAIYNLSALGKIPIKKYDPVGYTKSEELKKSLPSEKGILEKIGQTTKSFLPIAIIGGLAAGYLLFREHPALKIVRGV